MLKTMLSRAFLIAVSLAPLSFTGSLYAQTALTGQGKSPGNNTIPLATQVKGSRPRANSSVIPPAAKQLLPSVSDLVAPNSLALPTKPDQVKINQLRPLGLLESENIAEVNNPDLRQIASLVDQAQSNLRSKISLWYPTLTLQASQLPGYTGGQQYTKFGSPVDLEAYTTSNRWDYGAQVQAQWSLINPQRVPAIAAARDQFEKAKDQYLIALREIRLKVNLAYFDLQQADDSVRIGQESVRASIVSLRDVKARYQAGVATKLEVLEADTQLARDQQLLTDSLATQAIARRALAALLNLPQSVTPTAKDPARVIGVWQPSLQESIVAAYAFREELDQALLDISIANSNANEALGSVQPFVNIFNNLTAGRYVGGSQIDADLPGSEGWAVDNQVGLGITWNIFDGGAAAAAARASKQQANQFMFEFARKRDEIRLDVESSFYELEKNNRNLTTTAREVLSAREALRLARLRLEAGVTTQREVVNNQRDLTQAEVRHSNAISDYNKRLAELRRRTGLDQIALCTPPELPATKPTIEGGSRVPVEQPPLQPACQAAKAVL
ncbi:MAG: TolC family protein [Cyanobacteriota bacterium]|nr:TolC family protein [Cyanobacteriota bacterium]